HNPNQTFSPAVAANTAGAQATNMADIPGKGAPKNVNTASGPQRPAATSGPPRPANAFPMAPPLLQSGPQPMVQGAGGVDEDHERWLIQKEDKMDYGPFPLRE